MRILYKIANKLFRIVKKILKLLTSRMVIIGVALLLEFCWLAGIMMQLNEKSVYINYAVTILSLIAVLSIINNPKMNPGYKLMWAVCILALPVTGICLYGILGHSSVARKFRREAFLERKKRRVKSSRKKISWQRGSLPI